LTFSTATTWTGVGFGNRFAEVGAPLTSFADLVELAAEVEDRVLEKGAGPAVMLASTPNCRRRNEDFVNGATVTGLVIDLDEGVRDIEPIHRLVAGFRAADVTYHYQWRKVGEYFKVHLLLPYAEPVVVKDPGTIRQQQTELTGRILPKGITFDAATAKPAGLCYFMTRRPNLDIKPTTEYHFGSKGIDFAAMYPPWLQGETRRKRTRSEATEEAKILLGAIEANEWIEAKGAWDITCPVGHGDDYRSKTYLYPNGVISCMAGKCQGKPLAWFLSHLPEDVQTQITEAAATPLKAELAATQNRVTVAEAATAIAEALRDNRAIEGHATVVQVSTGAGKTRAIAEYLNLYSAPYEGERVTSGLTAVLAVPTNALLREVDTRLDVPHVVKTGVLAVLNNDGTPACRKFDLAKALQNAGGNVHRLLCSHCEFKEGCSARDNAEAGEGSLTLTNHALMPAVATSLHDRGRHPLLVWDESPQWVETGNVLIKDLDWLTDEFDREALPPRTNEAILDAMVDVRLFHEKYRAVVRPVIEALRWIRTQRTGVVAAAEYVRQWASIPKNRVVLARARDVAGVEASKDPWQDLMAAFKNAARHNRAEMGFDGMRKDTQARVLRAERVLRTLNLLVGEDAVLVLDSHHISVASLTPNGSLFRRYGGVVLDATANLAELRRLRPDLRAVTLRVKDAGNTERYLQHATGLDRKSLTHRPERLVEAVNHAMGAAQRWGRANGAAPKTVVFTYMAHHKTVAELWPEAEVGYFGNTRGYDRYFQEGFNTFVTIGDPVTNLSALALQWRVLTGKLPDDGNTEWQRYIAASAESELAQAHGRARNPQASKSPGGRLHLHYGRRVPAGWDQETCRIDTVTFAGLDTATKVSKVEP
jgi:hypothetical protein